MMKKIISLLMMIIFLTGCGKNNIKKELSIDNNNRFIHLKSFVCDDAIKEGIMYIGKDFLVLNNGFLYDYVTSSDKLYSNNQMCKKSDVTFLVESVGRNLIGEALFFTDDNMVFESCHGDCGDKYHVSEGYISKKENGIVKYWHDDSTASKIESMSSVPIYYVLKNDGSVYKQLYEYYRDENSLSSNLVLDQEALMFSSENYGRIIDYKYYKDMLITENGLYFKKTIKTEECEKYEDIECESKMAKSQKYEQYQNDIEFLGIEYTLLKDGTIISTDFFISED